MTSPSHAAVPVKLPVPPSSPHLPPNRHNNNGHNVQVDSVAARALAALEERDIPSSLDVHIRWDVTTGSIVRKGDKIAQLFYSFHGSPPPQPSSCAPSSTTNNGGNTIIRARIKKKRWGATTSSDTLQKTQASNGGTLQNDNNFVTREIRAPSDGFLRILYTKTFAFNAVQINKGIPAKYSVIDLNLAAIEPCEHPAVVGGLCAVCGADTRVSMDKPIPRKHQEQTAVKVGNKGGKSNSRREHVASRQQKIIDKQKKLAASISSAKEFDNDDEEEFANFDMDAAVASHAKGMKQSPPDRAPAPKIAKATGPPTAIRSLSSLLSGAKATQQMQQNPPKQKQPPEHKHAASRRLRQAGASSSASTNLSANHSHLTVSGGVTIAISESEAKNISDASSKKLREEKKLCLVLDLDHTLLHATDDYRAGRFVAEEVFVKNNGAKQEGKATKPNPDIQDDVRSILLPIELPPAQQQQYVQQKFEQQKQDQGETKFCLQPLPQQNQSAHSSIIMRHFVKLRPHLKEFFSQIQSTYQLSVYTAGTRSYAEQVAVMICRHLVDAPLDEEELNTLRSKVREKDEECKKYREYKARIGRKRQLELAKAREDEEGGKDNDKMAKRSKKSVAFPGSSANAEQSLIDLTIEEDAAPLPAASSGDDDMNIPRKKKRVKSGSLLASVPNPLEVEEELVDPTAERDALRKELEEAEKLEIAAVELRRKLFGSRIVSRTDVGDLGKDVKSLKRVFPCGGSMAAILDDREDVWANAKNNVTGRPGEPPDNLLLVRPYHWKPFIGYADVNNASGQDLSKTDDSSGPTTDTDKEEDVQLLWTADILRRLHERYYSPALSQEEREGLTVPGLLQSMRKETLLRFPQVKVVLSGLIPINKQNKQSQVRHQVIRYCEELGAEVLPSVCPEVTHVVAARDNSEKIKQARREVPGCYIVRTSWLMECWWSISRRDVRPHHMGPMPSQQHAGQHALLSSEKNPSSSNEGSKDNAILLLDSDEEEDEDDDFEDDFAADLEKEMMKGK